MAMRMTQAADLIRDKRRHWAAPGGSHDQQIRLLAVVLPGAIGAVAAVMILAPLSARAARSASCLIATRWRSRERAAAGGQRDVSRRGQQGSAVHRSPPGSAVQASARVPVVELKHLAARIRLADGPAELTAPDGIL